MRKIVLFEDDTWLFLEEYKEVQELLYQFTHVIIPLPEDVLVEDIDLYIKSIMGGDE